MGAKGSSYAVILTKIFGSFLLSDPNCNQSGFLNQYFMQVRQM